MSVSNVERRIVDIAYVFCIMYLSIFTFLYKTTGFAYTTVGIMTLLLGIDILLSRKVGINIPVCFIIIYISIMFLMAFLIYEIDETDAYFKSFIILGTVGFYFANRQPDFKKVIVINSLFFSFYMFIGGGAKELEVDYFNMSCAMLPGICSLILASLTFMKEKKKIAGVLFSLLGIFFLFVLASHGSRSSIVSIFVFILILLWFYFDFLWMKIAVMCVCLAALGFVLNIEQALSSISNFLNRYGIEFYAISKSIEKLHGSSGISSGRNIIQKQVFENLNVLNVLFGKGISSFEATYGTYPHNIVLNLFVDYGLIGVAFFSYIIALTVKILKRKDQNEKMIIILLFSSAIVPLLFSFTYWRYPAFFLYIGIVLSKRKQIKYKR